MEAGEGGEAVRRGEAGREWNEFPHQYELQQPKRKRDEQAIANTCKPYLEARDWISINRGTEVGFTDTGFEARGPASEHASRNTDSTDSTDSTDQGDTDQ